jgi:8-oxo-dGTP pyrophosphatase MutT (NUDIX family)
VRREFSAGGVLVRPEAGCWYMAAIRPAGKRDVWALPKGRIDDGESGEQTALREVEEETGARGRSLGKLGDVRYWFHWEGERVFKVVSFFLLVYEGGELGDVADEFRHEIDEVAWLALDDADALLTHKGEREMAGRARARLAEQDV